MRVASGRRLYLKAALREIPIFDHVQLTRRFCPSRRPAFEMGLVAKGHVHKTESLVAHCT